MLELWRVVVCVEADTENQVVYTVTPLQEVEDYEKDRLFLIAAVFFFSVALD